MTRCLALCLVALLCYGWAVGCGGAGWIGTRHRAVEALEGLLHLQRGPAWSVALVCRCRLEVYSERWP